MEDPTVADHFEFFQWLDFVSEAGPAETVRRMAAHLETGCRRCRELERLARELVEVEAAPATVPGVPDHVLWAACALIGSRSPETPSLPRLPVRLVRDAARAPKAAGSRGGLGADSWQGFYEREDLAVHVRLEHDVRARSVLVVGQVVDRRDPPVSMAELPASLLDGDELLDRTSTNNFGEFEMQYDDRRCPELRIGIRDRGLIEIRLDRFPGPQGGRDEDQDDENA